MHKFNFYHSREENLFSSDNPRETSGFVGYLRGDFEESDDEFRYTWFDDNEKLNNKEFKEGFDKTMERFHRIGTKYEYVTEGKRMNTNIDIIYSINEILNGVERLATILDNECEKNKIELPEIYGTENEEYLEAIRGCLVITAEHLKKLTIDYRKRLEKTEFCISEFIGDAERMSLTKEVLANEFEAIMEEVWSLHGFCDYEVESYLQMTQATYEHKFGKVRLVVGEESMWARDFLAALNSLNTRL